VVLPFEPNGEYQMRTQVIAIVALGAVVIAAICFALPRTTVTLNEAGTDIVAIDIFGLTNNAQESSEQRYAEH